MSDQVFQDAYARVRGRHSDQVWFALSPREITESIYREIRLIDVERTLLAESGMAESEMAESGLAKTGAARMALAAE